MGSFLATMLTPFLRGDVSCFGSDQCYPLAFGVPALLMLAAIALFFGGRSLYRRLPASGENIIVQVWRIIASSYRRRREPQRVLIVFKLCPSPRAATGLTARCRSMARAR